MKPQLDEIKEWLSTVREEWVVWRFPTGGVEIFEKDSRATILQSNPTDANGRFDGAVIAKFPQWIAFLLEEIERLRQERDSFQRVGIRSMEEMADFIDRIKLDKRLQDVVDTAVIEAQEREERLIDSLRSQITAKDKVLEAMQKALEEIADYDVFDNHGYVDEWSEAASFSECRGTAIRTLQQVKGDT